MTNSISTSFRSASAGGHQETHDIETPPHPDIESGLAAPTHLSTEGCHQDGDDSEEGGDEGMSTGMLILYILLAIILLPLIIWCCMICCALAFVNDAATDAAGVVSFVEKKAKMV